MHNGTIGKWRRAIRKVVKGEITRVAWKAGVLQYYSKVKSKNRALILAYHRTNTREYIKNNKLMPGMYLSDESLEVQIKWLKDNYRILPITDIVTLIKNRDVWNEPVCAITFDDGWYDTYEYAFPILKKYRVSSTVFVVGNSIGTSEPNCFDMCFEIIQSRGDLPASLTGYAEIDALVALDVEDRIEKARMVINKIRRLPARDFENIFAILHHYYNKTLDAASINERYKMLTWANIRQMQEHNVEFGYHSKSHYMMTQLPIEKLSDEIEIPLSEGDTNGVHLSRIFCYPDGQHSKEIVDTLKKAGYIGATTLIPGFNGIDTDPYLLRRLNVHEGGASTLAEFQFLISRLS